MSINYVAIKDRDSDAIGPALEGGEPRPAAIDPAAARAALMKLRYFKGGDTGTLKWERDNAYAFVDISGDHVLITHGTQTDEDELLMDVIMETIHELQNLGLNVWDPQQGNWFPG